MTSPNRDPSMGKQDQGTDSEGNRQRGQNPPQGGRTEQDQQDLGRGADQQGGQDKAGQAGGQSRTPGQQSQDAGQGQGQDQQGSRNQPGGKGNQDE